MKTATILVTGIGWPEGLRWRDGTLWFSDVFGRTAVHAWNGRCGGDSGTVTKVVEVPGSPSGLGWTPDGDLLVVSMFDGHLLRVPEGTDKAEVVADLSARTVAINDMVVAADGTAYIGDNGFHFGEDDPVVSRILRVSPSGEVSVAAEDMYMPNGMVIVDDGRTLIVAESLGGRLSRFAIAPDGTLGARGVYCAFDDLGFVSSLEELMERPVVPDGICADRDGNIWVGNPLRAEIGCVSPSGQIVDVVALSQPGIACALGGPTGRTLFVGTGVLDDQAGTAGAIEVCEVTTPGW